MPVNLSLRGLGSACGRGFRAYDKGKFTEAIDILKPIADIDISILTSTVTALTPARMSAVAVASYYVAIMYSQGKGTEQDTAEALKYVRKAAELKHPDAIKYLRDVESQ